MRLIAGLATLLSVLCFASDVSAHASLVSAQPGDGSVLTQAPKTVQLRFNEAVKPSVVRLIDSQGSARDDAKVLALDEIIVIMLPDNLPRGTQVVSYRVISADGHPVAGSLLFSIGVATATAAPQRGNRSVASLIWLTRICVYLGLFAGVGGVFFGAWIAQTRAGDNVIVSALIVGLFGAVASLALQGLDVLGLPLRDIMASAPWNAALATSLAPSLSVAIAAMAAAFVGQRIASARIARVLSACAIMGVGVSLSASGHAATASPIWLNRPMVFLHGVGVAYWAGALAPLAKMAWQRTSALPPVLDRFSRVAIPVVGVVVLTGLALAFTQLGSLGALIETRYGIILSIKTVLVLVLLGFAALNRFRLTPRLAADLGNTRPLVRSILAECVVVAGILALVAGWRFTPPPRALAATLHPPLAIHIHTDKAMFQVLMSPGDVGADSFVLQLMDGEGSPLEAKEAKLTLSLPGRGIEPFERAAMLGADGYWHVGNVPIPYPGRWHLRIDALVTDFEKITLEDDIEVAAR